MFLRRITVENLGPIEKCDLELPFHTNGEPKPVVLVGENGSGKSILLSLVVNSIVAAKQLFCDDSEVEKQKVYKLRSPLYIGNNKRHYFTQVLFENDIQSVEWQLLAPKKEFAEKFGYTPDGPEWGRLQESETSIFWTNFNEKQTELRYLINKHCLLYFPANRFEEPAWLNLRNLMSRVEYTDLEHLSNISDRRFIQYSSLKANQNWLMDILFDSNVLEQAINTVQQRINDGQVVNVQAITGHDGSCSRIYRAVIQVLQEILRTQENLRLGFGNRSLRRFTVMRNDHEWIPNLFQLSTGQALVFDLVLTIIRDYDLTGNNFTSLSEIKGLVLIDEIELHLHTSFQYEVLPNLIKSFPKVQFIISSHSPVFLLGMQRALTDDGFCVVEMPSGKDITTEEFGEFGIAYCCFKETRIHAEAIRSAITGSQKPIIFVEGDHDIKYLRKAAQVLAKEELLESFSLLAGDGFGNLDNIWKHFNSRLADTLSQKVILLYDCDTKKPGSIKDRIIKKVIEKQENTPIEKGIENLFPADTIKRASAHKKAFIDSKPQTTNIVRGENVVMPAVKEVNVDEKGNLCDWICEIGTEADFVNFSQIFNMLEDCLRPDPITVL